MAPEPRPTGRPRVVTKRLDIAPLEQILLEAGRLFAELGFKQTTTRQIAEAAGLRQGSLYYYFKSKDDMLAELLDRIAERALEVATWVVAQDASAAARVWALAYLDVANYCDGTYRLGLLTRLPEAQQPRFAAFWEKIDGLQAAYQELLARGRNEGSLAFGDLEMTALMMFGMADGPGDWFDPTVHDRLEVARLTARAMLLAVLADPATLAEFVAEGEALAAGAPHAPTSDLPNAAPAF